MSDNLSDFERLALDLAGETQSAPPTETPDVDNNLDVINDDVVETQDNVIEDDNLEESSVIAENPDDSETATPDSIDETDSNGDVLLEGDVNLDDFSTEEPEAQISEVDYSALSNDLGFAVTSKDDVVSRFQELNKTVETLKTEAESADASVPDDLKEAMKLAKDGGDYLEYLKISSVDYDNINEVELFEYEVAQIFTDSKGNVDSEGLEEYLDGLSDVDKKLKGRELKNQYKQKQEAKLQVIAQEAARKKATADAALKKAVDSIKTVAGFKVSPNQKANLVNDISSGKMVQSLFYDKAGNYDFNKIAENYFKIQNFDKIQNFYKQRVKTSTKREILQETTNSNVNTRHSIPNAKPSAKTSDSVIDSWIESMK